MTESADPRRSLPAMNRLLDHEVAGEWVDRWGRDRVVQALRGALSSARTRLSREIGGDASDAPGEGELLAAAETLLRHRARRSLRPVLNGTGVVLHTNLGRAPLSRAARQAVEDVSAGYANLEYDLEEGGRSSRHDHGVGELRRLTGAEAALVVNNNAAAVALAVNELARDREVVVSRGELVEIGGSFRVPEIVVRAGATLREVGTTNRTRAGDYRAAVGDATGMILKVHPSNYRLTGFVSDVELETLVDLGRRHGVPVVHDLGSGLLRPELLEGFPPEPSPAESLEAGADLVTWSGDKLLGGPQAGVLLGTRDVVRRLRSNPLLRTFRVDKMSLAALEATLRAYADGKDARSVPALRMLRESAEEVKLRARTALRQIRLSGEVSVRVAAMPAVVGGGSYPDFRLPSAGWRVSGVDPAALDAACRAGSPPLVGRIREDEFLVDFRTLPPGQEGRAARVLEGALEHLRAGRPPEAGGGKE